MFTGIVEEVGRAKYLRKGELFISCTKVLEGTCRGDSLSVNGACLTATRVEKDGFAVELMPETLKRTNLGDLRPGQPVNLERALALGGRLGGHLVQGHVDATGHILYLTPQEEAVVARFSAPPELMPYIVEKGFIAVDGVSLTAVEVRPDYFTCSLVRYTMENTTLGQKKPGDKVNLEGDIVAKYVEKFREGKGITLEFLSRQGFA
jgi:riboflavin synthase